MHHELNLNDFREAFARIKKREWIQSSRKGPTGIGQTLEQALGLRENNIALPDLGRIELKAHRIGSSFRADEEKLQYLFKNVRDL